MEGLTIIVSILAIHVFAWFTPGPQIALIIRNSLIYSRRTGFWTATGFAIGNFIHILLSVVGIGLLISQSPIAHNAIKYLGVGYLIYLGVKTIFAKVKKQEVQTDGNPATISPLLAMRIGLVTNLLSPKAPLFFASIFGSLLSSGAPKWVVVFLMFAMPLNTLFMASMWSLFFTHRKIKNQYTKYQPVVNKLLGCALVLLALKVALS